MELENPAFWFFKTGKKNLSNERIRSSYTENKSILGRAKNNTVKFV